MTFDGKAKALATGIRSSHSKAVRANNCRRFDKLCSLMSEQGVWKLLREERKAADMARSLGAFRRYNVT